MSSEFVSRGDVLGLTHQGQLELLRGVVEHGAAARTAAFGESMWPFIHDGDVLTIAPLQGRAPCVGEVVAAEEAAAERLVIHRCICKPQGGWLLRGDNAAACDDVVRLPQILGRVVEIHRDGRGVRFGLGREATLIAALSRRGLLQPLVRLPRTPRRVGGTVLRCVQGRPGYRSAARRVARPVQIVEADEAELRAATRRLFGRAQRQEPNASSIGLVAKQRGRVVGVVQLEAEGGSGDAPEWWLYSLVVWAPLRGLGIGEALLRKAMARAREGGARALLLAAREGDGRPLALYRKLGFEPVRPPHCESEPSGGTSAVGARRGRVVTLRCEFRGPG